MRHRGISRTTARGAVVLLTMAGLAVPAGGLVGTAAAAPGDVTVAATLHYPVVRVGYDATMIASVARPAGTAVTVELQRRAGAGAHWHRTAVQDVPATATDGTTQVTFDVATGTTGHRELRVVAVDPQGARSASAARSLTVVAMRIRRVSSAGDEYAVVVNKGRRAVDLHLMRLGTEDVVAPIPHRMLKPGAALRVYTGVGTSTASRLYLSRKGNLWGKHGTAQLTVRKNTPILVVASHTF